MKRIDINTETNLFIRERAKEFLQDFTKKLMSTEISNLISKGIHVENDSALIEKNFSMITSLADNIIGEIDFQQKSTISENYSHLIKELYDTITEHATKEMNQRINKIHTKIQQGNLPNITEGADLRSVQENNTLIKVVNKVFDRKEFTVEAFLNDYTINKDRILMLESEDIIDKVVAKVTNTIHETEQSNKLIGTIMDKIEDVKKEYGDTDSFGGEKQGEGNEETNNDDLDSSNNGTTEEGSQETSSDTNTDDASGATEDTNDGGDPTSDQGNENTEQEGGEGSSENGEKNESVEKAQEGFVEHPDMMVDYTDKSGVYKNNQVTALEYVNINYKTSTNEEDNSSLDNIIENVLQEEKNLLNNIVQSAQNLDDNSKNAVREELADKNGIIVLEESDEDIENTVTESHNDLDYFLNKIAPKNTLRFTHSKVYSKESITTFLVRNRFRNGSENGRVIDILKKRVDNIGRIVNFENNESLIKKYEMLKENVEQAESRVMALISLHGRVDNISNESTNFIPLVYSKNLLNKFYIVNESDRIKPICQYLKTENEHLLMLERFIDLKFDIMRQTQLSTVADDITDSLSKVDAMSDIADNLYQELNFTSYSEQNCLDSVNNILTTQGFNKMTNKGFLYTSIKSILGDTTSKIMMANKLTDNEFTNKVIDAVKKTGVDDPNLKAMVESCIYNRDIDINRSNYYTMLIVKESSKLNGSGDGVNPSVLAEICTKSKMYVTVYETLDELGVLTDDAKSEFRRFCLSK